MGLCLPGDLERVFATARSFTDGKTRTAEVKKIYFKSMLEQESPGRLRRAGTIKMQVVGGFDPFTATIGTNVTDDPDRFYCESFEGV